MPRIAIDPVKLANATKRVTIDPVKLGKKQLLLPPSAGPFTSISGRVPGRPLGVNSFDPDKFRIICDDIAAGKSLQRACRREGFPHDSTVRWWILNASIPHEYLAMYAESRILQLELWADETVDIADDGTNDFVEQEVREGTKVVFAREHVMRSTLRINTRQWNLARLLARLKDARAPGISASVEIGGQNGAPNVKLSIETVDPVEASRVYQQLMHQPLEGD